MTPLARCSVALLATLLSAAAAAGPASAVELMAGGYGAGPAVDDGRDGPAADADPASGPGAGGRDGFVLDFTPRAGLAASGEAGGRTPSVRLELGIAADADPSSWPDSLALGGEPLPSWLADGEGGNTAALSELSIGGTLHWSGWSIGGGFARTALLGGEADLMSASIGYGSLTASLAYGQAERPSLPPLDVLKLSTDLAAWSWLTLESDLALGSATSAEDEESVAVGRLGFRLSF